MPKTITELKINNGVYIDKCCRLDSFKIKFREDLTDDPDNLDTISLDNSLNDSLINLRDPFLATSGGTSMFHLLSPTVPLYFAPSCSVKTLWSTIKTK